MARGPATAAGRAAELGDISLVVVADAVGGRDLLNDFSHCDARLPFRPLKLASCDTVASVTESQSEAKIDQA
jgi:hypothetical protein